MANEPRNRGPRRQGADRQGADRQRPGGQHGPQGRGQDQGLMGYGNALIQDLLKQGHEELDDLVDLTPSQARWVRILRQLEMLNPEATVQDLSMALSLRIWNAGQMWDDQGKSSYPGLILDYEGGEGHKSVRFGDGEGSEISRRDLLGWAKDDEGSSTNVNHAFPAIAAQAGRSKLSAEYASFMATSGGDTLQNMGAMLVEGENNFSSGEYAGNLRAEAIADRVRDEGGSLSEAMLQQFRKENADR
jgi:hypothetical protein